jgi:hypothetical protein
MIDLLELHGTRVFVLPPGAIISAAQADLRLRDRKRVSSRATETDEPSIQGQHYAFHRRHVARARDVAGLLTAALRGRQLGMKSGKKNTRAIYADGDLLERALKSMEESKCGS